MDHMRISGIRPSSVMITLSFIYYVDKKEEIWPFIYYVMQLHWLQLIAIALMDFFSICSITLWWVCNEECNECFALCENRWKCLKLVHTLLKYRVLGISTAAIFLPNDHSLHVPIYLGWLSCMLSFVWHQSTCQVRVESEKMQNEQNSYSQWNSDPQPWDLKSDDLPHELTWLRRKLYCFLNDLYV